MPPGPACSMSPSMALKHFLPVDHPHGAPILYPPLPMGSAPTPPHGSLPDPPLPMAPYLPFSKTPCPPLPMAPCTHPSPWPPAPTLLKVPTTSPSHDLLRPPLPKNPCTLHDRLPPPHGPLPQLPSCSEGTRHPGRPSCSHALPTSQVTFCPAALLRPAFLTPALHSPGFFPLWLSSHLTNIFFAPGPSPGPKFPMVSSGVAAALNRAPYLPRGPGLLTQTPWAPRLSLPAGGRGNKAPGWGS